jgi:zinc protease
MSVDLTCSLLFVHAMLLAPLVALSVAAAPPVPAVPAGPAVPPPFTQVASVEGITEYALPNGLKVLLVPDASKPSVTVCLTVFVGSRNEGYGERGMAHLFEHMLFKRTKKLGSIKDELTKLGALANGTTNFDRTNYFETIGADDAKLGRAIELESQRLRYAIVSKDELATEMTVVRNELEAGENDPGNAAYKQLFATAYTWHNYGGLPIGPRSDIEKVPNERLLAWYETYYQPDNAMLVVAGKFDLAKTFTAIAGSFGPIPRPKRVLPTTYTEEPVQDGERSAVVRRVGGVPVLMVGYHIPSANDPDTAALRVAAYLLGDSPSGRLYKALVEPKKAADVSCSAIALREPGLLQCEATLAAAQDAPGPAREALPAVVEDLQKAPPAKEDVERAKTALLKGLELALTNSGRVGLQLSETAAQGDWRTLFINRDRLEQVTPGDVARVAQRYLKASNRTLVEYVPTEKPDRAEVPLAADIGPVARAYRGRELQAQGEVFEATTKNLEARTARSTLANGMKLALLSKKTRGESVRVSLQLKYGDEQSLKGTDAAGTLAAEMVLRGTKTKTRQQVKDAFDALKANVGVGDSPQTLSVTVETKRPNLVKTLELVAECLQSPAFDAKEFEALRREMLAGYEQAKDDPSSIGQTEVARALAPYPKGHPLYVVTAVEAIEELKGATLEQAKAFQARFYGAQAGLVAVVGDFDQKEVADALGRLFGGWKGQGAYTRIPTPFRPLEARTEVIQTPDKAMAFYGAVMPVQLKDVDPDYPTLVLDNYLLGGGFLSGRVPKRLREKEGLSYGAGTSFRGAAFSDSSSFVGYAIYAPQNLEKVDRGFFEEVQKAVDAGFTPEELSQAREGLLRQRETLRADDGRVAGTLVSWLELDRTYAFDEQVDQKLRSVSLAEVNATLKKYLDPRRLSVVKVGDFKPVQAPK